MFAATSHLLLLDRVLSRVRQLSGGSVSCDIWRRRKVPSLFVFFKINSLAAHSRSYEMPRSRTVQFSRSFVLYCVRLWNGLHESVFAGEGLGAFKTSVNRFFLQD